MVKDVDAYILAGGKSERMKTNKALLPWNGTTIIEHLHKNLEEVFANVYVVTKDVKLYSNLPFKIVVDLYDSYCPLVGIFTAVKDTKKGFVFIKACDNPLFSQNLVMNMYEKTRYYDIVIPKTADGYHPLFGFYSKRCLSVIYDMIKKGDFRIINLFNKMRPFFLKDEDIITLDKKMVSLRNINTPQDFSEFKKRFEGEDYDKS